MKRKIITLAIASCMAAVSSLSARMDTKSVGLHLAKSGVSESVMTSYIDRTFGQDGVFSFQKVRSYTDSYGTTHTDCQQYFNGVAVENCILIVHSEGGMVLGINGQVAAAGQMRGCKPAVTAIQAVNRAKSAVGIKSAARPFADLVYTRCLDNGGDECYRLAYRTRLTSLRDGVDVMAYIDGSDGSLLKTRSMTLNAAVGSEIITRQLELYYPTKEGFDRVKHDIRMTGRTDGTYTLSDDERKIYIHMGRTVSGVDNPADLAPDEYIRQIQANTPLQMSGNADEWLVLDIKDVTIDTIANIRQLADGSDPVRLDTVPLRYICTISDIDRTELFRVPNYTPNKAIPPFTYSMSVELYTNTTYYLNFIRLIPTTPAELSFINDTVMSMPIRLENAGTFKFDNDSVSGSISLGSRINHALDVQNALHSAYEYYRDVHNRIGFDNKNTPLHAFVDLQDPVFGTTRSNAFAWADAPYFIATGVGDGRRYNDVFTCFDMLVHEFTHLVIMTNGRNGLVTTGETGAINEAIPDCFAVAADFFKNGSRANWQIGEEGVVLQAPNMRDLSNPKMSGGGMSLNLTHPQPDTYGGEYWMDPKDINTDNGGVHINNGVFNYWFYLITEGGNGTNDNNNEYSVSGLGVKQTEKLLMDVVLNYITPEMTYSDMYNATRMAAEHHFGGAGGDTYKQVTNAWQAVGVNETTSDVEQPIEKEFNVCSSGGKIIVEAGPGTVISVYSILGQLFTSVVASENTTVIEIPESTAKVVIVKAGNQVKKVVL
ncbi:MAG: M4 family metallopeptidase [Candidatus Aphodosoma sp.]